jgi:hypothetical protein
MADVSAMVATDISVSDIWATSGVLLGLQVAATSYRISAEVSRRAELLDAELVHEPPWLAPCELLNLGGMAVCVLLVFVLPMTLHSDGLVQVGFSVYALLYAAYPFALLGHHSMFSSFLSSDEPPPPLASPRAVCTEQERNVILVATVAVCAQLLGSLASPGGGPVAVVVIVMCPLALCFYALVHRAAEDAEEGGGRHGRRRTGGRKKPYRQLKDGGAAAVDEETEDFRYEVQIEFDSGAREDVGLELREGREGIEVSDVRPDSLAARAPHCCPGMVLVRISSKGRKERSALDLLPEDVLTILDEERPVTLTFEHPWQRETDSDDEVYFYNSFTDEAVWDRPTELGTVVKAMRRWYGAGSAVAVRRGQNRRRDDQRGRRMSSRSRSPRGSDRSGSLSPTRRVVGSRRVTHREAGNSNSSTTRAHTPRRDAYRHSPGRS